MLRYAHVAVSVRDIERSRAWYCALFGLSEWFREESDERTGVVLHDAATGFVVGLVHFAANNGEPFSPLVTGLDHVGFTVDDRADLDEWQTKLDRLGVEHSGVVPTPIGAILNCKDPDGIQLAFFWFAPGV